MKLFVGELSSAIHRKVVLAEYLSEEDGTAIVKNMINAREGMNSMNQLSWALGDDPYWMTDGMITVNLSQLTFYKVCEPITDSDLIERYQKAVTEIKMRRSNLVKPENA